TKQIRDERQGRSEEEMLLAALNKIKEKDPGACAHLDFNSETKEVHFILIQTTDMRKALLKFPEVILMDLTYKINKNMMPVSVIQIMNGEGKGEAVCYAFLANEKKETLTNMLLAFCVQSGQDIFAKTNCIVVDKDFSEIGAIRAVMPNAKVHICSVHVEKNVKKAARGDPNKKQAMESFKCMLYAENDSEFQIHLSDFSKVASKTLHTYFVNNWLLSKEAWSLKDRITVNTLRNHTTNRILDVNSTLYDAVNGLVGHILASKRDDARYRDHEILTKTVSVYKCSDPVISRVCNELTIFAAKLISDQYEMSKKPSPVPNRYEVSEVSCSCVFFKSMALTCRHIMRFRKSLGIPQYDKASIPERWWLQYNLSDTNVATPLGTEMDEVLNPRMPAKPVRDYLAPREKFKQATEITQSLNPLLVDVGTKTFHERRQLVSDLLHAWKSGTDVSLLHHVNRRTGKDVGAGVDTSEEVPFTLSPFKVIGNPKGIGETIHDGSKKIGTKFYIDCSIDYLSRLLVGFSFSPYSLL
ncbi:hypothetical protein KUF71_006400, partial [Frankliniella fusca]